MLLRSLIVVTVTALSAFGGNEAVAGRRDKNRVMFCQPQSYCAPTCSPSSECHSYGVPAICYSSPICSSNCVQNYCTSECSVTCTDSGNSMSQQTVANAEPGSVSQEVQNLNAAVTAAKNEINQLRGQLLLLNQALGNVDKKVTVGPDSDPTGVGKAVDERLPKKE